MDTTDIVNLKLKLLSTMELDAVAELVIATLESQFETNAVAILLWDPDLESFGDRYTSGKSKKELGKFVDAFIADSEPPEKITSKLDPDDYDAKIGSDLVPIICHKLMQKEDLVACLLIAGSDANEADISSSLGELPLVTALNNAWQYRELERENERLRSQYEDMEDKVSSMEDQTRKLIQDLTTRDLTRTRQVVRDRLVYSISNIVRSSLNIQKVLETAVEQIGTTFATSRCLILRAVDTVEQLNVFEYTQKNVVPAQQLFFSPEGLRFAEQALQRSSTHEVAHHENDKNGYDDEFLKQLDLRSGLLVPLVLRDRILGTMFLQHCDQDREWTIDDVSLVGALADNLSVAIENAELHQEREQQAVTDGLTGVANRRSFNETFAREFERAKRYGEPLSLVVIDLDFLKKINDNYGHQTGDEAIKAIGRMLKQSSRTVDLPARYGGEEFCLLLPNTEIDMAEQLADRLRRLINDVELEGPGRISASIGVASYPLHAEEPDELFQRADEALYVAKQGGRNRVCVAKRAEAGAT